MDTYLNVYPGYYVSTTCCFPVHLLMNSSLQEMVLGVTMRAIIGSVVVSTTLLTFLVTDCRQQKSRQLSLNIVSCKMHALRDYDAEHVIDQVAEAAVVGINDELTGQAVNAFVSLKEGNETTDQVRKDLILQVRKSIGPFAAPKAIFVVDDLPKTRSGKIMRRILRKILSGEEDSLGDISTVSDIRWRHIQGRTNGTCSFPTQA